MKSYGTLHPSEYASYNTYRKTGARTGKAKQKSFFGHWFEGAVAKRITDLLVAKPEFRGGPDADGPVSELRFDVVVARVGSNEMFAQYDVLILLSNAAAIHIECKTGGYTEKDSYARVAKLDHIGGPGASQIICYPLFTGDRADPKELQRAHSRRKLAEAWGMRFLGYTQDGQPNEYYRGRTRHEAPSFEDELERLLRRYCRPQSSSVADSAV